MAAENIHFQKKQRAGVSSALCLRLYLVYINSALRSGHAMGKADGRSEALALKALILLRRSLFEFLGWDDFYDYSFG